MMTARTFNVPWNDVPLVWIPQQKFASFALNVTHLVLPAGELWFCRLFNQALPLIKNEELRQQVKLFVAQEGAHARGHRQMLELYEAKGWDFSISKARLNTIFNHLLGEKVAGRWSPVGRWKFRWLRMRIGMIAGIEHLTCVLGNWVITNQGLKQAGADKRVLDLLMWHGVEEVEHRTVAFDLYHHLGGGRFGRMFWYALGLAAFVLTWTRGTQVFLVQDQVISGTPQRYGFGAYRAASQADCLPRVGYLIKAFLRYFKWNYHPIHEADSQYAEQVLNSISLERFEGAR